MSNESEEDVSQHGVRLPQRDCGVVCGTVGARAKREKQTASSQGRSAAREIAVAREKYNGIATHEASCAKSSTRTRQRILAPRKTQARTFRGRAHEPDEHSHLVPSLRETNLSA